MVEPGGRLVEEQQLGLERQRARQLHPFAYGEGKLVDQGAGDRAEAEFLDQGQRALADAPLLAPGARQGERIDEKSAARDRVRPDHDVLERRHRAEQREVLERPGDAQARDLVLAQPLDGAALEADRAALRPVEARQAVEERGLAGAVRADQTADFTARDVEIDVVERDDAAESDRQASDRKQGGRARRRAGARFRYVQFGRPCRWRHRPWNSF